VFYFVFGRLRIRYDYYDPVGLYEHYFVYVCILVACVPHEKSDEFFIYLYYYYFCSFRQRTYVYMTRTYRDFFLYYTRLTHPHSSTAHRFSFVFDGFFFFRSFHHTGLETQKPLISSFLFPAFSSPSVFLTISTARSFRTPMSTRSFDMPRLFPGPPPTHDRLTRRSSGDKIFVYTLTRTAVSFFVYYRYDCCPRIRKSDL